MLVNENQLDQWVRANAERARGVIVELVARLVAASCPAPHERRFPLGDSIGQTGPDGLVDTEVGALPFVPVGRSYWQIGTGLDPQRKATEDYRNLTAHLPEDVRQGSTFVFVTPLSALHTWPVAAQELWLAARRSTGDWKSIQLIDGTRLVDWLSRQFVVEAWLAQIVSSVPANDILLPEHHWQTIASIGKPTPLPPALFLANRDAAAAALRDLFSGRRAQLRLTTRFPEQIPDFVSAYIASMDDQSRLGVSARCIIVLTREAWASICSQYKDLVLVAHPSLDLAGETGVLLLQRAHQGGHAVVFFAPHGGLPDETAVPLPMSETHQVMDALRAAGYPEHDALTLAHRSAGNLPSLLRNLQGLTTPEWAQWDIAPDLAIAMSAGGWADTSSADRTAVESLSTAPFDEWQRRMRDGALRPGTPLVHYGGSWKVLLRFDAWYALGSRIYDEHLERLREVALSVLSEDDPQFDLPHDQRFTASIHGIQLRHSHILRQGLADTLALLGSHARALTSSTPGRPEATAAIVVRELLRNAHWVRWASLNELLPLLAEAAPSEFLSSVEAALRSDPCPFPTLFAQEGKGFLARSCIHGLLWALETLAWDAHHLSRATACLSLLALLDPGGQSANRPANSLATIFLPWLPRTYAPVPLRLAAVRSILGESPSVGWKLVLALLPQRHSVSFGTRTPVWRDTIPSGWRPGATYPEYWEQVSAYAELAIEAARGNVDRLVELIDHLRELPPPQQQAFLEHLGSESTLRMEPGHRQRLADGISGLLAEQNRFPDMPGAVAPSHIDALSSLAQRLQAGDPFLRHQRLFIQQVFTLFEATDDYEGQRALLEQRRSAAVQEILAAGGSSRLFAFAQAVESPSAVGLACGTIQPATTQDKFLPQLLGSPDSSMAEFARGYVWGMFHAHGWDWVDHLDTSPWSADQIAGFFTLLPFTPQTWQRLQAALGSDQAPYWTKTTANPYESHGLTDFSFAVAQLVAVGRPSHAIGCLHKMLLDKLPIDPPLAMQTLLALPASADAARQTDPHEVVAIIQALQNDPQAHLDALGSVEWAFVPWLDGHRGAVPRVLWARLARDPGFYCELIRTIFPPAGDEAPAAQVTEGRKRIATNAYSLVTQWKLPPGSLPDGTFSGEALRSWLQAVDAECTRSGHREVAMTMAGHALAYAPPDPGGLWIHSSVAHVLDAEGADLLREGFRTELFNSRGAHWVDPSGAPERELAAGYHSKADALDLAGHHRLAAQLRGLASEYEREALRVSSPDPSDL